MGLLKCPKCGEMFSDSYKTCPFCAEDEEFYNGKKKNKNAGRRVKRAKAPSVLGPIMVLVVLLLVGFLIYVFLGNDIAGWFGGKEKPVIEEPIDTPEEDDKSTGTDVPAVTLSLDKTELTLNVGEGAQLTASGAEGSYTWQSSDPDIVSVDENGAITAAAAGTATVSVTAEGAASAACEVTVAEPEPEPAPEPTKDLEIKSQYGSLYKRNQAFSMDTNTEIHLRVEGTDSTPTWEIISGGDHVSVDSNGVVTRRSRGTAVLKVSVDGQTFEITIS